MSGTAGVGMLLPVAAGPEVRGEALRLVRAERPRLAVALVLNALAAAVALLPPQLLGGIVDEVSDAGRAHRIDSLALGILLAAVVQIALTRFAQQSSYRFGENVVTRLRLQYVSRVLAMPSATVEQAHTGDLTVRSTGDMATISRTMRSAAPALLLASLQTIFLVGATWLVSIWFGLCILLGVPLMVLVTRWYLARSRKAYLAEGEANSMLAQSLSDTIEGAAAVEAFGLTRQRIDIMERWIGVARTARLRTLRLRSVLFPAVDLAHVFPVVAMVLIASGLFQRGAVSLGECVAVTLYAWRLAEPLDVILAWIEEIQSSTASLARVLGVPEPGPGAVPRVEARLPNRGDMRLDQLGFSYPHRDQAVLSDVDLTVPAGTQVAVVGPSGAGKSTLARLILGVESPSTGRIQLGDVEPSHLGDDDRRHTVMLVTQEHHVFACSLRANLAIAAPAASDADMTQALRTVGAHWADDLPAGLDTDLGAGAINPDAAQAQQIALSRVILANPQVVVLDEATAVLTPSAARDTERAFAQAVAGRTVIAIAHRLQTAAEADLIIVLDGGRLIERGTHEELLTAGGTYAWLWRSWQEARS